MSARTRCNYIHHAWYINSGAPRPDSAGDGVHILQRFRHLWARTWHSSDTGVRFNMGNMFLGQASQTSVEGLLLYNNFLVCLRFLVYNSFWLLYLVMWYRLVLLTFSYTLVWSSVPYRPHTRPAIWYSRSELNNLFLVSICLQSWLLAVSQWSRFCKWRRTGMMHSWLGLSMIYENLNLYTGFSDLVGGNSVESQWVLNILCLIPLIAFSPCFALGYYHILHRCPSTFDDTMYILNFRDVRYKQRSAYAINLRSADKNHWYVCSPSF